MIAEFRHEILPGLATLVIMVVVLVLVLLHPLRSEREIKERRKARELKFKRSTDVLNVESKGGNS